MSLASRESNLRVRGLLTAAQVMAATVALTVISGCNGDKASGAASGETTTAAGDEGVPAGSAPTASGSPVLPSAVKEVTVLTLMKHGAPFMLVDITPEFASFASRDESERRRYVLERAATLAIERGLSEERYDGHDVFAIRLIMLSSYDECQRPLWGDAVEVALLRTTRKSLEALRDRPLTALSDEELAGTYDGMELSLGAIDTVLRAARDSP